METCYQAEQIKGELTTHLEVGVSAKRGPAVADLIGQANALCLRVSKLTLNLLAGNKSGR
jgi:hypothetical protein